MSRTYYAARKIKEAMQAAEKLSLNLWVLPG